MYKKILVPLDGSYLAETVLPHVEAIATGCHVTEVVVLRVIEPIAMAGGGRFLPEEKAIHGTMEQMMKDAREYLALIKKRLQDNGITAETEVINGKVTETIVDYVEKHGVDLVVMTTHGFSGFTRWTLGGTADRIVHVSCVPVLLVRPPECVPHK